MDDIAPEYDVVVLGTGMYDPALRGIKVNTHRPHRMCALWVGEIQWRALNLGTDKLDRVLSVKGKKVLHIDRNDHYGGYVQLCCVASLD
jgi:RAB protein geranylgeranyltransferase component A